MLLPIIQMQLSVGEDLLQNTENFAIAVGDVLTTAISTNATNETSRTIERQNIGVLQMYYYYYYCSHSFCFM